MWRTAQGGERVWSSRHHRKGLIEREASEGALLLAEVVRSLFMPQRLNWWIGALFAVGASLFALGSILCLFPALATAWSRSTAAINATFFAGSIPFTSAAYLQLWQAANAAPVSDDNGSVSLRRRVFGWRPGDIGWLSCALQFAGTLLFNINTFDAMLPNLTWVEQDLTIWIPNFIGSVAFLASGYLAFIELCHQHWAWRPHQLSWWLVFVNLWGCIFFMASALTALALPQSTDPAIAILSLGGTLAGALCFFAGAVLTLVESAMSEETAKHRA